MSPWRIKNLSANRRRRLFVRPNDMVLVRQKNGALAHQPLPSPLEDDGLAAAADCLRLPEWQAAGTDIILSNRCVRYCLSEPPGRLLGRAEELTLIEAEFRRIYGDAARRYRIRTQSQPPDAGVFGAAVDEVLAQALEALVKAAGAHDYTVRTLLDFAARDHSRIEGWWVLVEPGWLTIVLAEDRAWRHVSGQACDGDWTVQLPSLLVRAERLVPSQAPRKVWVQTLGYPAPHALNLSPQWDATMLAPTGNALDHALGAGV